MCPVCSAPVSGSAACDGCGATVRVSWRQCPSCRRATSWSGWLEPGTTRTSSDSATAGSRHQAGQTGLAGFTHGSVARAALEIEVGETLAGRYDVRGRLGRGGFGDVYHVLDSLTGDERALKVVIASEEHLGGGADHLLHEFKLTDRITDNKHIIRVYDPSLSSYRDQPVVLLPMQLADGGSLRQWLRTHASLEQRQDEGLRLFLEACRGVQALHAAGLAHLDLKPENILVLQGSAKVADFGIGRFLGGASERQPTWLARQGVGTAVYMSPEQFEAARQQDVGTASDLYSLGVILYELLDGRPPFDGSWHELRQKHLTREPSQPDHVGASWWRVIRRCLAKAPKARYPSVERLVADVQRAIQGAALMVDVACPNCEHVNRNTNAKRCESCGADVGELFHPCPVCVRDVRLDIDTCPGCGADVAAYYLLQDRKRHIEVLKDEDLSEAIDLLETVLREGAADYRERAVTLIRELRAKQADVSEMLEDAVNAAEAGDLDRALRLLQSVLEVVPRHRLAKTRIAELTGVKQRYESDLARAREACERGEFDEAAGLLEGCLTLLPARGDAREQLTRARQRQQAYGAAITLAQAAYEQRHLQTAATHLETALAAAARAPAALRLQRDTRAGIKAADDLIAQAERAFRRADFSDAEAALTEAARTQADREDLTGRHERAIERQREYQQQLLLAQQALEQGDLDSAHAATTAALLVCPDAPAAQELARTIEQRQEKATASVRQARQRLPYAQFDEAQTHLDTAARHWPKLESLAAVQRQLNDTTAQYADHIRDARSHLNARRWSDATNAAQHAADLCPKADEPTALLDQATQGHQQELEAKRHAEHEQRERREREARERRAAEAAREIQRQRLTQQRRQLVKITAITLAVMAFVATGWIGGTALVNLLGGDDLTRRLGAVTDGGTLTLEAGTYRLRSGITIDRPLRIVGAGRDTTTIVSSAGGTMITFDGNGSLVLADLAIVYEGTRSAGVVAAVRGEVHLENVRLAGGRHDAATAGAGLHVERNARALVQGSLIESNGVGVVASGDAYLELSESVIRDNLQRGVSLLGRSSGAITHNLIERNGFNHERRDYWQGIGVQDGASPLIDGNTIRDNAGIGIQYRNSSSGVARNNILENNGHNGARYAPPDASVGGITIGVRGSNHMPFPIVETNNVYRDNHGGGLVDYRGGGGTSPPPPTPTVDVNAVDTCGSITDASTNLVWAIGPDRTMTWFEAHDFVAELRLCGSRWRLPTPDELFTLYAPELTAGIGFFAEGRHFPARNHPVFDAIGSGSWAWTAVPPADGLGTAINLYVTQPLCLLQPEQHDLHDTSVRGCRQSLIVDSSLSAIPMAPLS